MVKLKPRKPKQSASAESSTFEDEQQEKLRIYIADFDRQVEKRVQQLEREAEFLVKNVESAHRLEFLKIPKDVREMKWIDFIAYDGNVSQKLEEEIEFTVPSLPPPTKKKGAKQRPSKTATGARRGRSSRAQNSRMETPAGGKLPSFVITPKVNPRCQFTPATAARGPNLGEVTFSSKGSPVVNKPIAADVMNSSTLSATIVRNGQVLQVTGSPSDPDPANCPELDEDGMNQLKHLHNKLSAMLKGNQEDKE